MRAWLAVVVVSLCGCTEEKGTFGPPDAPRPVTLREPPRTPAPVTPPPAPPVARQSPTPAPPPTPPEPPGPRTREDVVAIANGPRADPLCPTGDPWLSFVGSSHPPERLAMLREWALDTKDPNRGLAIAVLEAQPNANQLETWRALAAEPAEAFPEQTAQGLLQSGGDAEVPRALSMLARSKTLGFVAKASSRDVSAKRLLGHIRLVGSLQPHYSFHSHPAPLSIDVEQAWHVIVKAEPNLVACLSRGQSDAAWVRVRVSKEGKPLGVETNRGGTEQPAGVSACLERVAMKLQFVPPSPAMFPKPGDEGEATFAVGPDGVF